MAGGAREEGGDERRARRATRDRRGRARAAGEDTPGAARGTSWSRSRRPTAPPKDSDPPADGVDPARRTSSASGARAAARRAETRDRARRRTEPARPDASSRTSRVRSGTDRPSTRRPRSDAVRARRAEPAERRGPTRGRYLARRWIALLAVLTVVAVAYLVMFTSVLGVRSVEVIGAKDLQEDAVLKAAAIEHGTPMVRLDADEAAARVAKLPRVHEVVVERSWPSTVEIVITERTPVAILRAGNETHLVDSTGLDYAKVTTPPPGLPTLAMTDVRPDNPATAAAVTVLGAIPPQLRTQVTTITANTPGDVRLTLADGRVVKWGNAEDNPRKATVLAALLTRPGKTYDVATPDFPTVSG
jgi:cell division protein FtsQ